jgi:cbb3-type cytochrome c oxidase subunit III
MKSDIKGMFQVLVAGSAIVLSPAVAALAQEQVIEGRTKTIFVTRCRVAPRTCEGSLTVEADGQDHRIEVDLQTVLERENRQIMLGTFGTHSFVRVTYTTKGGKRLARSVIVKGDLDEGARVFGSICFACHGPSGNGLGPAGQFLQPRPMDFTDANYMQRLTDSYLAAVVKHGKAAVIERRSPDFLGATSRPAFEGRLSPAEVNALVAFVRAFSTGRPQDPSARQLFSANCAVCHGEDGRGRGPTAASLQPAPADFTDTKFMARYSDETLALVITKGKLGSIKAGASTMPGFGQNLTDYQIWSVVKFLRTFGGSP